MVQFGNYSLYKNTDDNTFFRDYYKPINIRRDITDQFIIISAEFHNKPGRLAESLYGSPRLSWVFSYFNRDLISDIIFDLKEGMIIRIPTKERLLSSF